MFLQSAIPKMQLPIMFFSDEPTGSNFRVYALLLTAGSDPDVDLYVDNFFVASGTTLIHDQIKSMLTLECNAP